MVFTRTLLYLVWTQIELLIVIYDREPEAIEPAVAGENVAVECRAFGEIDSRVEFQTERLQDDVVLIGAEFPSCGGEGLHPAGLEIDAE